MTTNHPTDETGVTGREREELARIVLLGWAGHASPDDCADGGRHVRGTADAIIAAGYRKVTVPGPCTRAGMLADALPTSEEASALGDRLVAEARARRQQQPIDSPAVGPERAGEVTDAMVSAALSFYDSDEARSLNNVGATRGAIRAALAAGRGGETK